MTRSTAELVFEAADELLKEGTRPSQQNIRARIGKGSATTIHKALNSWWQQLSERLRYQSGSGDLPAFLITALEDIWQQAQGQARSDLAISEKRIKERLQAEREQLETIRTESTEKSEQLVASLERACQRTEELQLEISACRRENLDLEKQLIQSAAEGAELGRESKAQQRVIDKLEQQLAVAQQAGSGAIAAASAAAPANADSDARLEQENRNLRQTVAELDARLADRENRIGELQEELLDAKRRYYRLESGAEGGQALKEAGYVARIDAQQSEINRLLALLADKR